MLKKLQKIDDFKKHVDEIEDSINKINLTINDISLFADKTLQPIVKEKIDINEEIIQSLKMFNREIVNSNISIDKKELTENIGTVLGSKHNISRIINNILSNAIYAVNKKHDELKNDSYKKRIYLKSSLIELRNGAINC